MNSRIPASTWGRFCDDPSLRNSLSLAAVRLDAALGRAQPRERREWRHRGGRAARAVPLSHIARRGRLRPLRAIGFVFFFAWELIKATMAVAWEIITPGSTIEQGIIGIDVLGASDTLVTLVANFITLTPGTLTVEVVRHPTRLYIHVLHLRDVEAVRADVQRLEALAIRAFGSPEAIALLEGGIPSRDGVPGADRNLEEQP
ncbi:MAG: Na+/H+ antiporter subunit E [Acidimicrobiia bacterium]|nr:Na+/H+ antiporter subunit E [Acidimicrobiia bacterium]